MPTMALIVVMMSVLVAGVVLGWASYRFRARSPALALRGD
jgi:hypothetical protein